MSIFFNPRARPLDTDGSTLPGAKLNFYLPGTSTRKSTYTTSALTTAHANPVVADANGAFAAIYLLGAYKVVLTDSADVVQWTQDNVEGDGSSAVYPVGSFGAAGDGVTDDTTAIQAAITAAKALVNQTNSYRNAFGGPVYVDLGGRSYLVSSPISLDAMGGVVIRSGKLEADAANWTGGPVVRLGETQGHNNDRFAGLQDLEIECNFICDGVYNENARETFMKNVYIHGFVDYGFRNFGNVGGGGIFEDIRCAKFFFGETGYDVLAQRTGVGISSEQADCRYNRTDAFYCGTPIYVSGAGTHIFNNCHPFNGGAAPTEWGITAAVDNGSGIVRVTVASTTGLTTGDYVVAPWLRGISSAGGSSGGVFPITVVSGTQVDITGYTFAGTYDNSITPTLIKYADEPTTLVVAADATGVMFGDCQFDNGKVSVLGEGKVQFSNCYFLKSANGYNRAGIEFVADATTGIDLAGVTAVGCVFGAIPMRLTTINSGTFASTLKCNINANGRKAGQLVPSFGRLVAPEGTSSAPGLVFTGRTTTEDDLEVVDGDSNTGFYRPGVDRLGASTGGSVGWELSSNARLLVNHTAEIAVGGLTAQFQAHHTGNRAGANFTAWSADTVAPYVALGKSRGTTVGTINGQVQADDPLGGILFCGDDNAGALRAGGRIRGEADGTFTASAALTRLVFATASGASPTDRWKVSSSGHLLPAADNTYTLGNASFRLNELFCSNATINTSDGRDKTDVANATLGLDFLNSLRPVSYRWTVGGNTITTVVDAPAGYDESGDLVTAEVTHDEVTPHAGVRTHHGLIAQEVKTALDAAGVSNFAGWTLEDPSDPDSRQGLRYTEFIPVLIKAVQELSARIEALESA